MRLTTRTNLALRTLMVCAVNPDRIVRKAEVAAAINASENHLAQVINQLGQSGFITTMRGRNGGFMLAQPAREISVGAVFRTFESELPFMECMTPENTCPLQGVCRMSGHLQRALDAFYSALDPVTLGELVDCNEGLAAILSMEDGMRAGASSACRGREIRLNAAQ